MRVVPSVLVSIALASAGCRSSSAQAPGSGGAPAAATGGAGGTVGAGGTGGAGGAGGASCPGDGGAAGDVGSGGAPACSSPAEAVVRVTGILSGAKVAEAACAGLDVHAQSTLRRFGDGGVLFLAGTGAAGGLAGLVVLPGPSRAVACLGACSTLLNKTNYRLRGLSALSGQSPAAGSVTAASFNAIPAGTVDALTLPPGINGSSIAAGGGAIYAQYNFGALSSGALAASFQDGALVDAVLAAPTDAGGAVYRATTGSTTPAGAFTLSGFVRLGACAGESGADGSLDLDYAPQSP